MVRSLCSQNKGLKKGPWTPEEDQKLIAYIRQYGHGNWRSLPAKAGLQRCGKSCRLRWINYLKPDIKRGNFSLQEDRTILQLHALLGNKWSLIAAHLPKRTDNEIKNYWNTRLKKRLMKMGIDPITHKPKTNALGHLLHMAQWESARLEAETRHNQNLNPNPPRLTITKVPPPRTSLLPCLDILKAWQQQTSHSVLSPPSEHTNTNKLLHSNSMYALMLVNESSQNETDNKLPNPTIIISNSFGLGANHNIKYYSETGNNNDGYGLNPKENPIDDAAAVPEIDQKDNSNIPVLPLIPNNIIDNVEGGGGDGDGGLDDMSAAFDDYHDKLFEDEIGYGGGKDFDYWNTLLDLDDHFSPASPSLSEYSC